MHRTLLSTLGASILVASATAQQFVHTPNAIPGPSRWTEGTELVDVDLDGDLDLLFAEGEGFASPGAKRQNVLLINKLIENGSFSYADESATRLGANLSNAKGVTTADVNGDGYPDLLFSNGFNTDIPFLYINRGAAQPGFFDLESVARGFTTVLSSAGAQFGDLDDDGDLDVIMCDSGPNFLSGPGGVPRLYFNDGTGVFTEDAAALGASTKTAHMDVQLVDIDGDWDLDFVGLNRATNGGENHYLMLNDGTGTFSDASSLLPSTSGNVYEAEVGDLDGDKDHDLFFVSLTGFQEGHVRNDLVETGSLGFTSGAPLSGSVDDNEIVYIDFDNDGDFDILVGSLGANERIYRNTGGLSFNLNGNRIEKIGDSTLDATVGDVDNDGDYDVITAQGESNQGQWNNKLYTNTGDADDVPPVLVDGTLPGQQLDWPVVMHAKATDQVRDDGVTYMKAYAAVAPAPGNSVNVTLSGNTFSPPVVNLAPGESIIFVNQNGQTETITSTTAPYTYDISLSNGQAYEHLYVSPGTYDYESTVSGATGQIVVTGSVTEIDAQFSGGTIYRFAIPQLPASPVDFFALELFFEDWPGNVAVSKSFAVAYPGSLGTNYCGPAVANSSGSPATIAALGNASVIDNDFHLAAQSMPTNQFGYFLAAKASGFVSNPGGSQGNLCLGGTIGRLNNQVQFSGAAGEIQIQVDLTNIPLLGAVMPGETWYFQAWFRDQNPMSTSNFTDGVSVDFF